MCDISRALLFDHVMLLRVSWNNALLNGLVVFGSMPLRYRVSLVRAMCDLSRFLLFDPVALIFVELGPCPSY